MTRYIVRRILWLIPVLLFVSLITFTLMHITPGGPWDKEKAVAPQVVANLNAKYNLDGPLDVAVPQGRGHIRSQSHRTDRQEKPAGYKA
jgi:ABC-type dipeptide/oligopeptide/nickel transport system permease component